MGLEHHVEKKFFGGVGVTVGLVVGLVLGVGLG